MDRQHLSKTTTHFEKPKQTKKSPFLNNQKGLLPERMIGIAIWGIYFAIAIPSATSLYKRLETSGSVNLLSLAKGTIIIAGPLILSILAGSIHFYIENRHEDEKDWIEILHNTTLYLGCIFLIAGFSLIAYRILAPIFNI